MKQYLCVPMYSSFTTTKKSADPIDYHQSILNEHAKQGWTLDHIDNITTRTPAGCLAGLLGASEVVLNKKFYIFSREV